MALVVALHLTLGLVGGLSLGVLSQLAGGLTLDRLGEGLRRWFQPLRAERARRAAHAAVAPLSVGACATVLFLLNLRFFRFNNPSLAALLLVFVTAAALAFFAGLHQAMVRGLEDRIRRWSSRWPGWGDAVELWLSGPLGLIAGMVVGVGITHSLALAETWEALDLAPLVGLGLWALMAAAVEWFFRARGRSMLRFVGPVAMGLLLASWTGVVRGQTLEGQDNEWLHEQSWMVRMHLSVAQGLTDRDRDGFSGRFGHGDCDDSDPSAYPGSTDGPDCGPAVALMDQAEFEARFRGAVVPPAARPSPDSPAPPAGEPMLAAVPAEGSPPLAASPPALEPSPEAPSLLPTPPAAPEPEPLRLNRPYNILLITIDTVRADHCSFMGYERATTPQLERLAAKSTVFERAYAPSNMTPASIPAMLSGLYPTELWRDDAHFIRFSDDNLFVAEMLQAGGYDTRAVVTHWYFERRKRSGLYQGFNTWEVMGTRWGREMESVSTSALVSDEGLRQLEGLRDVESPWFLWLHYLDPHKWYIFHDGFEPRWGRRSKDRYDHEIAFTDHHVGRVLSALENHPAADRTAVIVTSDHGEAFGEHDTHFHGFSMYEDQLRVPLIVHVPGLEDGPRRVEKRVGLIDLTPTLLDLASIQPPHRLQGRSWGPDVLGQDSPARLVYAERPRGPHSRGLRALIDGDWKLVWRASGNRYKLFNLAEDPQELDDRMRKDPGMAEQMLSAMATLQRIGLNNEGKVR